MSSYGDEKCMKRMSFRSNDRAAPRACREKSMLDSAAALLSQPFLGLHDAAERSKDRGLKGKVLLGGSAQVSPL